MPKTPRRVGRPARGRKLRHYALLAGVLAVAGLCALAPAQAADGEFEGEHTYKQADGKEVAIKAPTSKERAKINSIERAGKAVTAEEEKLISDYFRYRIAELTWKESIPTLHGKRKDVKSKDLGQLGRAPASDLHVRLNELLLDEMQKVAADKRYPRAVRVNAVLMIGDLDEREAAGLNASVPLPEAEPILFGIFKDESTHDVLRIEALVGLMRHAEAGMQASANDELLKQAMKFLEAKELPKGKDPAGHLWLRMLACDTIKILADKGPEANQPNVVAAVEAYMVEKGAELWVRCRAAETLGHFEAKGLQSTAAADAKVLASLVVEISKMHDRLLESAGVEASKKKKKTAAAPRPAKEGEEEAPPAIPEHVQKVAFEAVFEQLLEVRYGLVGVQNNAKEKSSATRGLFAASDPAGQKFITDVVTQIDKMIKKLKDTKEDKTTIDLLAEVSAEGVKLEGQLKGANAAQPGENTAPEKAATPAAASADSSNAKGGKSTADKGATRSTINKPPAGNRNAEESAVGSP